MVMKERSWEATSTDKYRFSFNGKEKDDEVSVDGGSYDFGDRNEDSRLGRWLSTDYLKQFASPYCMSSNQSGLFVKECFKLIQI